jgi:peptide/nickel transport system permease protein
MNFTGTIYREKRSKSWLKVAISIIAFFVLLSFFAPWISNENPIYIHDGSKSYWPMFSGVNWQKICNAKPCTKQLTLIPFSAKTIDVEALRKPPTLTGRQGNSPHVLGTDGLGRDVLAALIHGSRTAIWISALAAGLAFVFGLFYGLIMGYYGQDRVRMTLGQILLFIVVTALVVFLMLSTQNLGAAMLLPSAVIVSLLVLLLLLYIVLIRYAHHLGSKLGQPYDIDVDSVGMRLVDMVKALPPLFIVLFALQIIGNSSIWYLILLIAYLLWASFARHSRAEVLRLRDKPSVQNALLTGRSDLWIWRYELIPFLIRPLLVTLAFSMASAVLLEATLSFLGLGLPADHVSWGTLINAARFHQDSWWLLVFPGLCMLLLIWSLQYLGKSLEERLRFSQSLKSV